ncbi:MAG: recombinase [Moraxellaceae bacterium]|nr:recombinase [Moraxellaceae bacterium]
MRSAKQVLESIARNAPCQNVELLQQLMDALRPRKGDPFGAAAGRLRGLVDSLRAHPHLAEALAHYLADLLCARSHSTFYADAGILGSESLGSALMRRIGARVLPPAHNEAFLHDLFERVFDGGRDQSWLSEIPEADLLSLAEAIGLQGAHFASARGHIWSETQEALRMLSHRLAALGIERELVYYFPELTEYDSPFLAQTEEVLQFVRVLERSGDAEADRRQIEVLLSQCLGYIERIRRKSQEAGAGVNLTYLLTRMTQIIERMRVLMQLLVAERGAIWSGHALDFIRLLMMEVAREKSVRDLLRGSTNLLARQVTEHASRTGEHYVTDSRSEYGRMFRAAAGAGVIVGFMALIKVLTAKLHLPPLWEAVAYSLNYGLGFVLVHLLHFTIATKQPAMTAATLAATLDGKQGEAEKLDTLVDLTARVCRTQLVAIVGNVALALATSFAIGFACIHLFDWRPIDAEKAGHMLHDLRPITGFAIFHAAIAGVYLFLSGLITGYYDNKAIYHRIPERIRELRWLRRVIGARAQVRLAGYIENNLGALAGNFLFGCMLGTTGTIGFLLGLPLDIRHVTFAAANLAYAWTELGSALSAHVLLISIVGVAAVGFTNLAVSFSLALNVALRARNAERINRLAFVGKLWRRFRQRPSDFLWPPGAPKA